MKIYLKEEINLSNIKKYLKKYDMERLGFDVDIKKENNFITVFIYKMGVSSIVLEEEKGNEGYTYTLVSEDIEMLHKPSRKLIDSNLSDAIEKLGGKVYV